LNVTKVVPGFELKICLYWNHSC